MKTITILALLGGTLLPAFAQPATSARFTLLHGEPGAGGGPVQNASGTITAEFATGVAVGGGATAPTGGGVHSIAGFTGQLYDVVSLNLAATPDTIDEATTSQLAVASVMDDSTTLALDPADVVFSVESGPLASISPGGLATAETVFEDATGTAQAAMDGFIGFGEIQVINVGTDDFGLYAGDGIDDDWQVGFFGLDNPDALPTEDPDGDGQNNRFEFIAGIIPDDPASRFSVDIRQVDGQPGHRDIVFSPFFPDRTYTVVASGGLDASGFDPLDAPPVSDTGSERTVTDTSATAPTKFYRVEILPQ